MMNPLVIAILGLIAGLFGLGLVGFSYAQLKADPEKDGYMRLREDIAANMGANASGWADAQNSKPVRMISFVFAVAFTLAAFLVAAWSAVKALS